MYWLIHSFIFLGLPGDAPGDEGVHHRLRYDDNRGKGRRKTTFL